MPSYDRTFRANCLSDCDRLAASGMSWTAAAVIVASKRNVSRSTLCAWGRLRRNNPGNPRALDRNRGVPCGGRPRVEMPAAALQLLAAEYRRVPRSSVAAALRRYQSEAAKRGYPVLSHPALRRRLSDLRIVESDRLARGFLRF